jgi:trans-2,3-dihydro-3-hydroxyanthranilate isomerase
VVGVFARVPLEGNPLAVFLDSVGLAPEIMQRIAREFNLSETVFVVASERSDCVARLRIFTPRTEMDFAGHPTVGACFVLTQQGVVPAGVRNFSVQENVTQMGCRSLLHVQVHGEHSKDGIDGELHL